MCCLWRLIVFSENLQFSMCWMQMDSNSILEMVDFISRVEIDFFFYATVYTFEKSCLVSSNFFLFNCRHYERINSSIWSWNPNPMKARHTDYQSPSLEINEQQLPTDSKPLESIAVSCIRYLPIFTLIGVILNTRLVTFKICDLTISYFNQAFQTWPIG